MTAAFWVDLLGWAGALLVVAAYALVSARRVHGDSRLYQLMNLAGGVLVLVNAAYHGALPSAFINVVWIAIALGALWRIGRLKGRAP